MSTILIFDQAEYPGGSIARAVDLSITMPDRNFIIATYHPLHKLYSRPLTKNIKAIRLFSFYNYQKKYKHTQSLKRTTTNALLLFMGQKLIAFMDWLNEVSLKYQAAIRLFNRPIDLVQANAGIHFLPYHIAKAKRSALIYYFRHLDDYGWATEEMIQRASHYIFVGKNLMERHRTLIQYQENKCQVIYSPFNTKQRLQETKPGNMELIKSLKDQQRFIILMAAHICYEKGQEIAVEALGKIAAKYPQIMLLLAGKEEPRYTHALRKKITQMQLNNNISFMGHRNDIPHLLNNADLALQAPLWFEALGGSLVEAMQLGTLTISADTGGTSEVIEHGRNGFLFSPGNSDELAQLLEDVLEKRIDTNALRKAAQEHTNKLWNPEKIHKQMSCVYSDAIKYKAELNQ